MIRDTYKHKGLRKKLISILKAKGIEDEEVLKAIEKVPRHLFVDNAFEKHAYEDKALQIGEGQTISQPYTVAFQTQLLDLKKGEKILEIGTGSGYQASILYELGAKVFSIERQKALFNKTQKLLKMLGYGQIKIFFGDGYQGLPLFAPFDKIIVTAGAESVPEKLLAQLKVSGKMVIPVGSSKGVQKMLLITKNTNGGYRTEEFDKFRFVPMLPGKSL